jgi:hypothetical protein
LALGRSRSGAFLKSWSIKKKVLELYVAEYLKNYLQSYPWMTNPSLFLELRVRVAGLTLGLWRKPLWPGALHMSLR